MARGSKLGKTGCGFVLVLAAVLIGLFSTGQKEPDKKPARSYEKQAIITSAPATRTALSTATEKPVILPTETIQPASKPTATQNALSGLDTSKYKELSTGDASDQVLAIKKRLQKLGYYSSTTLNASYTDHTVGVVKAFQRINGLPATGIADPKTQALLFSNMALMATGQASAASMVSTGRPSDHTKSIFQISGKESPDMTPQPDAPDTYVWVSRTGSKYHSRSTCSNMNNPTQISRSTAISRGLTPCKVCKPR